MPDRDHTLLKCLLAAALALAIVTLVSLTGGCAGATYTANRTAHFDISTGEASPDRGCRIVVTVDGAKRFELAENPAVDCAVTVEP